MTHVDTLRRYLQPSTTLRWHPWAPLIFGVLLLAFVFWLGARWGFETHGRTFGLMTYSTAHAEMWRINDEDKRPARAITRQAATLDAAIHRWVLENSAPRSTWEDVRDRMEAFVFWNGRMYPRQSQDSTKKLAEFRLAHLSGRAPRWQRTTAYCDAYPVPLSGEDLRERYRRTADEYSLVLGRAITAEQLAPLVPGFRCEWKGPTPF